MNVEILNDLPDAEARELLMQCCGSLNWAHQMVKRRPFQSQKNLFEVADEIWMTVGKSDWLEAFAHHPKIGDLDSAPEKGGRRHKMAKDEQASMVHASDSVQKALRKANQKYFGKFGFIFIICATGRSADQILSELERRLKNQPEKELMIAALEQSKITKLRLEKL